MSDKRRGLGRGLGALIPTGPGERQDPPRSAFGPRPVDLVIAGSTAAADPHAPTSESPSPTKEDARAAEASDIAADGGNEVSGGSTNGVGEAQSTPDAGSESDAANGDPWADGGPSDQGLAVVPGATFAELPIAAIRPNPKQPRQVFDEEAMAELVASLREVGLLQPVVVRRVPTDDSSAEQFELIMGERRWRASQEAGFTSIPAIIRSTADNDLLRDALLENLHRSQLNPLEEAAAYQQLLEDFGCSHDELATRIGRSRPQISNTLRLLRLPAPVQRRVAAGVLSAGHARALLSLDDHDAQDRLASRIVAEGLSVRAVEEIVAVGAADQESSSRRVRSRRPVSPRLSEFADSLSDRFETRVKIDLGRRRGKITVEFASLEDLERILGLILPGDTSAAAPSDSGRRDGDSDSGHDDSGRGDGASDGDRDRGDRDRGDRGTGAAAGADEGWSS